MVARLERKTAIDTAAEAVEWLGLHPVLLAAFVGVTALEALSDAVAQVGVLATVAWVFVAGVAVRYALAEVEGRPTTLVAASRATLPRLLSLLGALVLYVLAFVAGFLAFVVPGIYVALRLSLAFPAIVIDGRRAVDALETSWAVAHGNVAKLGGIALAVGIAAGLFEWGISLTGAPAGVTAALELVVSAGAAAVVVLAFARVYLENRPGETAPLPDDAWGADARWQPPVDGRPDEVSWDDPRVEGRDPAWREDRDGWDDSRRWR